MSRVYDILNELIERYPVLEANRDEIYQAYHILEKSYQDGKKLLVAGNGGSAADAEHIVGELMKCFTKRRPLDQKLKKRLIDLDGELGETLSEKLEGALPAISLNSNIGLSTAFLNDVDGRLILAQEVNGYGNEGDVFMGISTSGNAENINYAAVIARAKGLKTIALTGKDGGKLKDRVDVAIVVKEMETYKIQELHLPVYHALCAMLEERFFSGLENNKNLRC